MARFVSLLFFLSLSLCCCRSQGQGSKMSVRLRNKGSPLALGNRVELECVFSGRDLSDSGVSWMLQHRQSAPQFILFITSLGRVAPTENGKPPTRFEAKRESSIYRLTVKSFQEQDQGNYYCIVNHNQRLHFSSGIPLHLPAPPTTAPSTKATTTQPSTTTEPRDCKQFLNTAKATEKGLDLSCHLYVWVPLASACLLLLIALLATITMCQKTRRRRCKCKRPMNGSNGKPSMPNRYT
ncbi:T-cell surface glycoprotein CD8 alpha chain [Gopherus flavomarginatus]|uniref:T-cell surface glycoprotein CD8 alpha chain n=1 Tax=Gopherus flavomarginatus TaxID=286002 RepID=UPI0021CC1C76|nr:T-cell surface glycoprotein CD8 alpha chain [Gopherus flavomarginatus]